MNKFNGRILVVVLGMVAVIGALAFGAPAFASGPTVVSARITGSNTITIVYSEPVSTSVGDYSNFTGSLANVGLVSVNGSGTNTIILTFSGSGTPFPAGASGYVTIGTNVYGISDSAYFTGGSYQVTSSLSPILTSFSASFANITNAFSTTGSTLTITFSANEPVINPTVTVLGHPITVNGNGAGPYTVNYTVATSDPQGELTAVLSFVDAQGNVGSTTVNIAGNGSNGSVAGYITSNANTSGVLVNGNSITFTLTPSAPQPNATVTGSYNGTALSWYTTNGGATYTATYVVANGQPSQPSPLQISGIILTNQYGIASAPMSGSDVQKTIVVTNSTTGGGGYITSNANTPGVLYIGNTITFNLVLATPNSGARISGSYNGIPLAWTTPNNGVTFTATYTVAAGQANEPSPVQITGVTILDQYGNASQPISGSDVQKTISVTGAPAVGTQAVTSAVTVTGNTSASSQIQTLQAELAQLEASVNSGTASAPSNASSYTFNNFLGLGYQNADVTALQKRLTVDGFYSGPITGYYGTETESAVKSFQAAHGIATKGYVGPSTRTALNAGE